MSNVKAKRIRTKKTKTNLKKIRETLQMQSLFVFISLLQMWFFLNR